VTSPEERLAAARGRLDRLAGADNDTWARAFDELPRGERELASARGEQYAELLDIGESWDVGAPLPHLLAGSGSAFVVCYASGPGGGWDGPPPDPDPAPLLVIEVVGCREVRLGGPDDEGIGGHPLHGKGLEPYLAHEVVHSAWAERLGGARHYVLAFHDEMVEAVGEGIRATRAAGPIQSVLTDLATRLTTERGG
jgi:hypothetical protein